MNQTRKKKKKKRFKQLLLAFPKQESNPLKLPLKDQHITKGCPFNIQKQLICSCSGTFPMTSMQKRVHSAYCSTAQFYRQVKSKLLTGIAAFFNLIYHSLHMQPLFLYFYYMQILNRLEENNNYFKECKIFFPTSFLYTAFILGRAKAN